MTDSSEANNEAVTAIIEAMDIYKVNINKVINDKKLLKNKAITFCFS